MTEQQHDHGERVGVRTTRSAPLDGRQYSRTIECEEPESVKAKRSAAVARGRGPRRGPEETEPPARSG